MKIVEPTRAHMDLYPAPLALLLARNLFAHGDFWGTAQHDVALA